jgi:tRNA (guanine10-N2)-dimethyltransferase
MPLAFHLSGEHESLPLTEIESLFSAFNIPLKIISFLPPLLIVESNFFEGLRRLAFTHRIVEIPRDGDFRTILDDKKSFRTRCLTFAHGKEKVNLEKRFADEIQGQFGGRLKASMRTPQQEIFVFLTQEGTVAGRTVIDFTKAFSRRTPTRRPFFHPSTMHPKLARCLVNLSGAREEILDPFCGSGAILIEAGLMGLRAHGMDISQSMIEGVKRNLDFYGVTDYDIWRDDACTFSRRRFEAVVTDLPYGRSTLLTDERETLYEKFIKNLQSMTGKAVVVLPEARDDFSMFELKKKFIVRVHRSLNRYIYILEER